MLSHARRQRSRQRPGEVRGAGSEAASGAALHAASAAGVRHHMLLVYIQQMPRSDGICTCSYATRRRQRRAGARNRRPMQTSARETRGGSRPARRRIWERSGSARSRTESRILGNMATMSRIQPQTRWAPSGSEQPGLYRANREAPKRGDSRRIARRSIKSRIARIVIQ